jgi:mono/diheme cytochrome c family protein/heme/copper-type cytochrome/quinol oxidase subunit 4
MSDQGHHGGIGKYVLVVLILAVVTYLEFALTAYPIGWLNTAGKLIALAVMSLFKFFMVIWFFMHLKDDSKTYTGFFTSGMVIAMGTFIALAGLFTVRSVLNIRKDVVSHEAGHEEVVEIPERAFIDAMRVPQPKDQHLTLTLPAAQSGGFSLKSLPGMALAEPLSVVETTTQDATAEEPVTEDVQAEETTEETQVEATSSESTSTEATETEASAENATETTVVAVADWDKTLGEKTYTSCVACHQQTGKGVPAAFPPQAVHAAELYNVEGGREYMINVVLYGLQGEIEVEGAKYNSIMTPWGPLLKDDQIASVLNYVLTSWGNDALLEDFTPITPEEVAAERDNKYTSQQVYELRGKLALE